MTHLVGMTVVAWPMRQNPAVTVYVQVKLIYISPVTFNISYIGSLMEKKIVLSSVIVVLFEKPCKSFISDFVYFGIVGSVFSSSFYWYCIVL